MTTFTLITNKNFEEEYKFFKDYGFNNLLIHKDKIGLYCEKLIDDINWSEYPIELESITKTSKKLLWKEKLSSETIYLILEGIHYVFSNSSSSLDVVKKLDTYFNYQIILDNNIRFRCDEHDEVQQAINEISDLLEDLLKDIEIDKSFYHELDEVPF